jgi:hypothetical protein
MKKFYISLLLIITLTVPMFPREAKAVNLGPFAVSDSFCQQVQSMSAILNSFQIAQWPVAGFPGIAMGLTQRSSIVLDICNFMTQLEQLNGVNAIFFSANYLNELTGKKWDSSLKLADKTWNLANSYYDFNSGTMRKGAMTSQSNARDLNDWMEDAYAWHSKTFNGQDAYIKHRGERENDMQAFGRASYTKAVLNDAVNCPKPQNTNYDAIYKTKVKPVEIKLDDYKDDMQFYKQQLYYMGPKFMNNDAEMKQYTDALELMARDGVTYKMTKKTISETTNKPSTQTDAEDHPILTKTKLSHDAYTYDTQTDTKPFTEFQKKWSEQWNSWVTAQWSKNGSFGALNGKGADSIQSDFIDMNAECNKARLQRGMDRDDPQYEKKVQKMVDECKASVSMNQKKAQSLLSYYVEQYQAAIQNYKNANAQIWSFESEYAGINHLVSTGATTGKDGSTFQQEQVTCPEKMQPAEMQLLQLKQQSVNNDINEQIRNESMKQTEMMQTKQIEDQNEKDENQRREVMVEQRNKEMKKAGHNVGQPFNVKAGDL